MRVLSLVHSSEGRSGVFGATVQELGHELDEQCLALGTPTPRAAEEHDAVLVFGGAMNVHDENDGHPWLREEKALLQELLEAEVPVLAVCLGGQLLAAAAGAAVRRAREPEIGWHDVELTAEAAGDPLFGALPRRLTAYQWHSYAFELPQGAVPLARSPVCLQAYRLGESAWGTQFHPEVTTEMLESWIDRYDSDPDAVRLRVDPGRARREVVRHIADWNRVGRELCSRFLATAEARAGGRAQRAHA